MGWILNANKKGLSFQGKIYFKSPILLSSRRGKFQVQEGAFCLPVLDTLQHVSSRLAVFIGDLMHIPVIGMDFWHGSFIVFVNSGRGGPSKPTYGPIFLLDVSSSHLEAVKQGESNCI